MEWWVIPILIVVAFIFYLIGKLIAERTFKDREREIRADAANRSRAVIGGQFSEQLAPFLPDFPYKPTEVKFLGKPVDFIVFRGLDEKKVEQIVFVEVKSGKASLTPTERSLRDAIGENKVSFEIYRVPEDLTNG